MEPQNEIARAELDAACWNVLKDMCGSPLEGTSITVTLWQDDAVKNCAIILGNGMRFEGTTFEAAIENAVKWSYVKHGK